VTIEIVSVPIRWTELTGLEASSADDRGVPDEAIRPAPAGDERGTLPEGEA